MSDLIADGIHNKFNCWECGIDMIIISESEELIKYCPYCEAELQDNYDISEDDITTEETGFEDLPNDWRL